MQNAMTGIAFAQSSEPAHVTSSSSVPAVLVVVAVLIAVCALIVIGVRYLDRQGRRESAATGLQTVIMECLRRDPALSNVPLLATASVDAKGALILELSGDVPSAWHRYAARRAVEREIRLRGTPVTIIDRTRLKRPRRTA
jgi:hypothetical protein